MFLQDWLKKNKIGYKEFCTMMNINRITLYLWLNGKFSPRSDNYEKLKKLTKGQVTYDEISKTQIQSKTKKNR